MTTQPPLLRRPLRLASAAVVASLTLTALAAAADRPPKPPVEVVDVKVGDAKPAEAKTGDGKTQPRGERAELFRRLCLDVTGRVPTEKEFVDFLDDESPQAFRNALDRIVAADGNPKRDGNQKRDGNPKGDAGKGEGGGGGGGSVGKVTFDRLDADRAAALDRKTKASADRVQEEKARADRAVADAREAIAFKADRVAKSVVEAKERAEEARDLAVVAQARKAADSYLGWTRVPPAPNAPPPPKIATPPKTPTPPKPPVAQPQYLDAKGDVVIRIPPGNNPSAVYATLARKTVSATYLGVGVETPGETLRSQLELGEGAGLVVNHVDDSGPTKSIVRQHDVLRKLDDQILVNAEQLVALVRMHKPGEAVELTVIRAAKPVTVTVKLGERQVQVGQADAAQPDGVHFFNSTFDGSAGVGSLNGAAFLSSTAATTTSLPYRLTTDNLTAAPTATLAARAFTAGPIRVDDGEWSIELPSPGGPNDVTLTETKTGKVIYQGPPVTQEGDPHAPLLPPEARKRLIVWQKALLEPKFDELKFVDSKLAEIKLEEPKLLEPKFLEKGLIIDDATDGTTTVVGKLINPATQPAHEGAKKE